MECLICRDNGNEPLRDNTSCTCKYKCHDSCWVDYVHSQHNLKCPLCRKTLSSKPSTTTATTSQPYSFQNEELTYEELGELLRESLPPLYTSLLDPQPEPVQLEPIQQQSTNQKKPFSQMNLQEKTKLICQIVCIVAVVVITVVIIATIL